MTRTGRRRPGTDPVPPPALGTRRAQVLAVVQESPGPVSAADVATGTGLHVNTARFHLDHLVDEGRATRRAEQAGTRGRPRILYVPAGDADGPHGYRMLADMLSGLVRSLDPRGTAVAAAGRTWGRRLAGDTVGDPGAPAGDAPLPRLDAVLRRVGFAQTPDDHGGHTDLHVHHCPFLEVAAEHPDAVCTLHRGLIEGALAELGGGLALEELRPFATPDTCVARLHDTGSATVAGSRAAVSEKRATRRRTPS